MFLTVKTNTLGISTFCRPTDCGDASIVDCLAFPHRGCFISHPLTHEKNRFADLSPCDRPYLKHITSASKTHFHQDIEDAKGMRRLGYEFQGWPRCCRHCWKVLAGEHGGHLSHLITSSKFLMVPSRAEQISAESEQACSFLYEQGEDSLCIRLLGG